MVVCAAAFVVLLQLRDVAAEEAGHAESHALMLGSVLGMVMLAEAQNLITFFVALELLSIPLYVLCGSHRSRSESLESGLKYLIVGSLGSATLLYGMAFIYGGSGATSFTEIAAGIGTSLADDPLVLIGIALCAVGLAFKVSIAPFHQWTPDVYEGAPTPVTAFMAVATKVAAFAVFARFFLVALEPSVDQWQPALAALAAISIVVGNVGALGQDSLKRLLGYSGIAQAGYMLVGLLVATEAGLNSLVFYLAAYTVMNLAAFAVITIRERETPFGDDIASVEGLARDRPELAWPLTIAMLGLAGLPGTAGFIGKLYLIEASVDGGYTWLAVMIVIGTMISLAYYLRVIAAVWMRPAPKLAPAIAGAAPEAAGAPGPGPRAEPKRGVALRGGPSGGRCLLLLAATVGAAAATVVFGVAPSPLVDFANNAGASIAALLGS
jgi:NADH-quinone oxidoreductase subunit N